MTLSDLKPGYVVTLRDGSFAWVQCCVYFKYIEDKGCWEEKEDLVICNEETHFLVSALNEDFEYVSPKRIYGNDIIRVYGFSSSVVYAGKCSLDGRNCLWSKDGLETMTLKQVCEKLGCEIMIRKDYDFL